MHYGIIMNIKQIQDQVLGRQEDCQRYCHWGGSYLRGLKNANFNERSPF